VSIKDVVNSGKVYVVAEIGQNHQGDINIAKRLIDVAKNCGANAVKSQKRNVDLLSTDVANQPYQSENSFGKTYGEHRRALELSEANWLELFDYAKKIDIDFFASPWDISSADFMKNSGCEIIKIPSPLLTQKDYVKRISTYNLPVILSTGMSNLNEIDEAVKVLSKNELYILQCTSSYPTEFEDINLNAITTLRNRYGLITGFSGHYRGIAIDVSAVTLGAKIIERHFTLDRTLKGTDHIVSLEPQGLQKLVRDINNTLLAFGDGNKKLMDCELSVKNKLRPK
jgi:sialic acid synthase SpsE